MTASKCKYKHNPQKLTKMEHIEPAIQEKNENFLKELSPEEFQQLLSSWFEEKGLIHDMKSYWKFQMINILKNTTLGKSMRKNTIQTYTLAQQALHLLVAEYLLYNQCQFTLALFSTEVNLSSLLPGVTLFFDFANKNCTNYKFDKVNLDNILELLGITKESSHYSTVVANYSNKSGYPLISCLLDIIGRKGPKDPNKTVDREEIVDVELEDDFMKNVHLVLLSANLPKSTERQLLHNLKMCYNLKTKSYENQFMQLVNNFKKEMYTQGRKLKHSQRHKQCLEKRVLKLKQQNKLLKEEINRLSLEENPTEIHRHVTSCTLNHCTNECTDAKRRCSLYEKENVRLQATNLKQKEEIERLDLNCKELLKEFSSCHDKVQLVNIRLQEETTEKYSPQEVLDYNSSESITEEILQEAREKLRMLEQESEELDLRFSKFIIK